MKAGRIAAMCGLFAAVFFSREAAGQDAFRLGTNVWPGYEPLYLAREQGYLDSSVVKLVEFRSATQVMHALETGAIDGGALTLDEVLTVTGRGVPLTVVMALDVSSGADSIIAHPSITRLPDLRGKRVAVENTALGAYMLLRALEKAELPVTAIEVVRMDVSRHVSAFESGEVSASVCFEPVRSRLIALGGRELFTSTDIPGEIVDLVAVRSELLTRQQASLRHLGSAWNRVLAHIQVEPSRAYGQLGRRMHLSPDAARRAYNGLTLLDLRAGARMLGSEPFRLETLARVRRFMVDRGLVEHPVDPAIQALQPEPD